MITKHVQLLKNQIESVNDKHFSILLIGERGTGKSKLLEGIGECVEFNDFEKKLREGKSEALIVDLIEFLSIDEQKEIFRLISTGPKNILINVKDDEGKAPICPQLIFTSQSDLTELYDDKKNYIPFIDRVAQQVFVLKPLRKLERDEIENAWESVNSLMLLESTSEYKAFSSEHHSTIVDFIYKQLVLSGNFRDLEKLSIFLWRFAKEKSKRSKIEVEDKLIEFKTIHEIENKGEFFKIDQTADTMISEFRKSLIGWAEKKYDRLSRAELIKKLGISEKTYYNWKNGI